MLNDILFALKRWRVIHLLGVTTLRSRYSRSKFGQAWLSITTFIQILCIGVVWSVIWRMEIKAYLPYVGVGHVVFLFVSQTINDSSGVFVADARLYLNDKQPFMLSVFAHLYRNSLVFVHNVPTIVALLIWSPAVRMSLGMEFVLGVFLSILLLFFSTHILATVCTRFRDLVQLVGLFFQLIFLVTPIMWKVDFLPERYQALVFINPFAAILDLVRNPLLGLPVHDLAAISLLGWVVLSCMLSLFVHAKLDRNIIYWV